MSPIRSGANTPNNLYVGTDPVQKIYRGGVEVWPGGATEAQVEALRTDASLRGIPAGTSLKQIGVDALPAGVSASATLLTVSGATVTMDSWDLGGRQLLIENTCSTFVGTNLLIYTPSGVTMAAGRLVDIYENADVTFDRCSFFGRGWYGEAEPGNGVVQRFSGTGVSTVAGDLNITECDFFGFGGDCIKSTGGGRIARSYFDVATNADEGTVAYDSDETYNTGDQVFSPDSVYLYASLSDDNIGNALPTGKTDNASWENIDPHSDVINPYVASAPLVIEECYMLRDPRAAVLGPENRAVGKTNGVRANRSGGAPGAMHEEVTVRNNIISGSWPTNASAPLSASEPDGITLIEDVFTNNWLGQTSGGAIMHPEGANNTISGNTDDYVPTATAAASPNITPPTAGFAVDEGASGGSFRSSGGFRIWTANSNADLVVTNGGDVNAIIVGGGASGGNRLGGGGGAGEYVARTNLALSPDTLSAVIGAGGAGQTTIGLNGLAGSNTTFAGLTALGGGGGGGRNLNGVTGGSGGGSSGGSLTYNGGAATASDGVGNAGGASVGGGEKGASGGGGSGGAGQGGTDAIDGNGGAGTVSPVPGDDVADYCAGGGAGEHVTSGGSGGSSTGGDGATSITTVGQPGTTNSGSGGGGGANTFGQRDSGAGGSGRVVVWWPE